MHTRFLSSVIISDGILFFLLKKKNNETFLTKANEIYFPQLVRFNEILYCVVSSVPWLNGSSQLFFYVSCLYVFYFFKT